MSAREEALGKYSMANRKFEKEELYVPENEFLKELRLEREERELEDRRQKAIELAKAQKELKAKLEMRPLGSGIIVKPYKVNPYLETVNENGVFLSAETSTFKNPDSGEVEELPRGVLVGSVVEVGPTVTYVKEGDDIMYNASSTRPLPFFAQGFWLVNESNVYTIINENLSERF